MRRINTRNIKVFRDLRLNRFTDLALVRTATDEVETDAIAIVKRKDDGDFMICPLLIIVNSKLFAK